MTAKRPRTPTERAAAPAAGEARTKRVPVRRSAAEIEQREQFVEQLLIAGVSAGRVERVAAEKFGVARATIRGSIEKVRVRWAEEERGNRPHLKAQAQRRLIAHIAEARKENQWSAIAQLERLLSEMQGTREPVEINLNVDATVTEAAMHVVANLSQEKVAELVERQKRLHLLAARAESLGVSDE